jgi:hypothetical protein
MELLEYRGEPDAGFAGQVGSQQRTPVEFRVRRE